MWRNKEGKEKLEECMKRLNIDEQKIKTKELLKYSLDHILSEKAKVKGELKLYDNEFLKVFGRMPNKQDKEIMRPLYIYYKNLKTVLDQKKQESSNKAMPLDKRPNSGGNIINKQKSTSNDSVISGISSGSDMSVTTKTKGSGTTFNNVIEKNEKSTSITSIISQPSEKNITSTGQGYVSLKQTLANNMNNKDFTNNNSSTTSSNTNNNNIIQKDNDYLNMELLNAPSKQKEKKPNSSNVKLSYQELEHELKELKKEQSELKQILHNYQNSFFKDQNRKVRFYKDILGVEREYNKYKENKTRIQEITELLKNKK